MTAPIYTPPKQPEELMWDHIKAMRDYAAELEPALGADNPIVKRIRSCAYSNEVALNRVTAKPKCEACGQDQPA